MSERAPGDGERGVRAAPETTASIRVIFGDTDQMGVVYYANYLRYFEAARGAYLRDRGRSYLEVEAAGYGLPVVEAHVRYRAPARYDDLLAVRVWVERVGGASVRFAYEVRRGDTLLAEGYTAHACVDARGTPARLPAEFRALLAGPGA